MELDCSDNREWYRVRVDALAEFVVRAYSEDHASLKVTYYCNENPWLEVFPDGYLHPECIEPKPLDPLETDYYNIIGDAYNPVRLTAYYDPVIRTQNAAPEIPKLNPNQNAFFIMDRRGITEYTS